METRRLMSSGATSVLLGPGVPLAEFWCSIKEEDQQWSIKVSFQTSRGLEGRTDRQIQLSPTEPDNCKSPYISLLYVFLLF